MERILQRKMFITLYLSKDEHLKVFAYYGLLDIHGAATNTLIE